MSVKKFCHALVGDSGKQLECGKVAKYKLRNFTDFPEMFLCAKHAKEFPEDRIVDKDFPQPKKENA